MTNEEIEQRLRDIECVLAVVTRQVELSDAARAAMRRLREGVTTEAVSTAQRAGGSQVKALASPPAALPPFG